MDLLKNHKVVIMGVANQRSLAWGIAQSALEQGSEVILTYQNKRIKKQLKKFVPSEIQLFECDVSKPQNIKITFQNIKKRIGPVNGIIHAIAYANPHTLQGSITDISEESFTQAQLINVYSLIAVARHSKDFILPGGSIITLTYIGSHRVIPNYNLMGISKAALEATVLYLAKDLGPDNIRINAISSGPIKTLSLTGIKDYQTLIHKFTDQSVDGQAITNSQIGKAAVLLLSPLAQAVTGDIIYVDRGIHLT
jgi:enoyl-[acyl-carrier protein] reductase I